MSFWSDPLGTIGNTGQNISSSPVSWMAAPVYTAQAWGAGQLFGSSDPTNPYAPMGSIGPGYNQAYDPSTMSMLPGTEERLNALQMDTTGLDKFRKEATRKGSSAWARLQSNKQFQEELAAREKAKSEARSATAQAESDLAMKGGLSSGARERQKIAGARDVLAMSQDVGRQGNLNRLQIGVNDEQNRIAQLSQLPGMENQLFQANLQKENMWNSAKNADIARLDAENQRRNAYNMDIYKTQMADWAATQQANATANSGKK